MDDVGRRIDVLLGLAMAAACAASACGRAVALETVRVGTIGALSDAGIYIAMDKGFFQEQGIQIQLINTFRTSGETIPFLTTGELDVGGGEIAPALVNAIAQGNELRVVAGKGSVLKGYSFHMLVVRKDLYERGDVRTVAQLKGRKIAVTSPFGSQAFMLQQMLLTGGLRLSDVELIPLRAPDMPAALQNGAVDAAIVVEPSATVATARVGSGVSLMTPDAVVQDFPIAVVVYSPRFRARLETALRWMVAYVKGLRYYNDALADPVRRSEVVAILSKYTSVKDPQMYDLMIWPGLSRDGAFDVKWLPQLLEFMREQQAIDVILPSDRIVDFTYVHSAVAALGAP